MHAEAFRWIEQTVRRLPPPQRVYEVGGRQINGTVRCLFPAGVPYLSIDLQPGLGVDVVGDAAEYTPPEPVDLVLCAEVLEHAPDPETLIRAAFRALAPGGVSVWTMATHGRAPHSGLDGGPLREGEPYANIDPNQLYDWLLAAGFSKVDVEVHAARGDLYAMARKA